VTWFTNQYGLEGVSWIGIRAGDKPGTGFPIGLVFDLDPLNKQFKNPEDFPIAL